MAEGDEDKMAFFAGEGVFCYRTMPFGLKNAGATYQRLVDKVFYDQIGRTLEAYVDDMVIKSKSEEEILADIKETFERDLGNLAIAANRWKLSIHIVDNFLAKSSPFVTPRKRTKPNRFPRLESFLAIKASAILPNDSQAIHRRLASTYAGKFVIKNE
ncbi:reverse transcriptase domain-containing protein, partial [Tanacetum coccineum]